MCLVITSVFGCAEVSDHHLAAGGHNLAVFLFAFNKNQIGFVCIFTLTLHATRGYMSLC